MDHLPLPANPITTRLRVPYVCDQLYAADGDWLTHPIRAGWPQVVPSAEYPQFSAYELDHPSDDRELERFFQGWIFFGLLSRVLSEHSLYNAQDYIGEDDDGQYVHTRVLLDRLSTWQGRVRIWALDRKIALYDELLSCLYRAEDSIRVLEGPMGTSRGVMGYHPGFNPAIRASLAAVCHTLTCAIDDALLDSELSRSPNGWAQIGWLHAREQEMLLHGWCPSEVVIVRREFLTLSAQTYYQYMQKPYIGAYHRDCTVEGCKHLQIDLMTYQTRHTTAGCKCESIGPVLEDVVRCLEGDSFPVLRIRGQSSVDVSVETLEYGEDTPYVAFSHVWADGLGNPTAITLPCCQLLRLRGLVNDLQVHQPFGKNETEDRELFVWCDSLCCPVEDAPNPTDEQSRQKRLAIAQMREVYTKATYVLVLDRSLETYRFMTIGPIEAAIRVFTSRWWRRLWTFQEAVLAGALLNQFADRAVDLRELERAARALRRQHLEYWAIGLDVEKLCQSIRIVMHAGPGSAGSDLPSIAIAIRHRGVSVPEDEPLCINTALNLDPVAMAAASRETRMETLWRAMPKACRGIPKTIIFNALRRLQSRSFRWAPASIQQSVFEHPQFIITNDDSLSARGTLTVEGLEVEFPAWRIRVADDAPVGLPHDWWAPGPQSQNSVRLCHPNGRWYSLMRLPQQGLASPGVTLWSLLSDQSKVFVVVLEKEPLSESSRWAAQISGLVASVHSRAEGTQTLLRSEVLVNAMAVKDNQAPIWQAAHDLAMGVREGLDFVSMTVEQLEGHVTNLSRRALSTNQQLAQTFVRTFTGTPEMMLTGLTINHLMGRYLRVEETFGMDSRWCVD